MLTLVFLTDLRRWISTLSQRPKQSTRRWWIYFVTSVQVSSGIITSLLNDVSSKAAILNCDRSDKFGSSAEPCSLHSRALRLADQTIYGFSRKLNLYGTCSDGKIVRPGIWSGCQFLCTDPRFSLQLYLNQSCFAQKDTKMWSPSSVVIGMKNCRLSVIYRILLLRKSTKESVRWWG